MEFRHAFQVSENAQGLHKNVDLPCEEKEKSAPFYSSQRRARRSQETELAPHSFKICTSYYYAIISSSLNQVPGNGWDV